MLNRTSTKIAKLLNQFNSSFISPACVCRTMSVEVEVKVDSELHQDKKRPLEEDDAENPAKVQKSEPLQRIKLKKHAMIVGYLGKDYFGMQRNPGMKTIEEDLLNALYKAELITSEALETMQTVQFQRAARTDKGVSARRQIVSILLPEKGSEEDINKFLPNEIKVFGLRRVTKGFNSKTQADARTYTYTLPTYAFAPEPKPFIFGEEVDLEKRFEELSVIDGKPFHEYRLPDSLLDKVNTFFKQFEGTHNFHNFTSRVKPLDPRAKRYMISCSCKNKFVSNGLEFATLEIKGQSFMLHQIRKMVAMTISFARDIVNEDTLKQAFGGDRIDIPIAPSLGLVLNYIHYDYYNKRYGNDGLHQKLDWSEIEEEIQKFDNEYIMKHIVDTEINEKTMLTWLTTLPHHHFGIREDENVDPQSNSEINE